MILTTEIIKKINPHCQTKDIEKLLPFINNASIRYEVDTIKRMAMFLAQSMVETMNFFYLKEIASGKEYEGRKDLGNIEVGDGIKYKGRGAFQTTGRANYVQVSKLLGIDCVNHPEMLEEPKWAIETAFLYWKTRKLNEVTDMGTCTKVTEKINGGHNALEGRQLLFDKAVLVLTEHFKLTA